MTARTKQPIGDMRTHVLHGVIAQFSSIDAGNWNQVNANVNKMMDIMERAVNYWPKTELILTPECSLQGVHTINWQSMRLTTNSEPIEQLANHCQKLKVWGVFNPWLKSDDGNHTYNASIVIDPKGQMVHLYQKTNPWIPSELSTPGHDINTFLGPHGLRFLTILSSDGEYPETWNYIASIDPDLIIRQCHYMTPFNPSYHLTNRAMAQRTNCHVVACNAVGMDDQFTYFGESAVYNNNGRTLLQLPSGTQALAPFELHLPASRFTSSLR